MEVTKMKHVGAVLQIAFLLCIVVFAVTAIADDVAVLKTGSRVTGKVLSHDSSSVSIEARVRSRTVTRKYPVSQIKSLTVDGVEIDLSKIPVGDVGWLQRD